MSFTLIQQATPRLHRSELAVPGSNPSLFEKAAKGAADIIFLDLEDAVAPDDKEQARKNIIQGLNDLDWGSKAMMIRINGLDTHYAYRDVVDVVENCPRLDMILIPKTGVPQDVYAIDMLVTQIEQYKKREKRIGFELLIETALGMANVEAIAQASKRVEAMSFGVADYAASTRARTMGIGAPHPPGEGRQGRGVVGRPPDRHRLDPPGRGAPQQGRRHGDVKGASASSFLSKSPAITFCNCCDALLITVPLALSGVTMSACRSRTTSIASACCTRRSLMVMIPAGWRPDEPASRRLAGNCRAL